jgi:CDP-diacylglycerol---serine O-phosphatidyltransferase
MHQKNKKNPFKNIKAKIPNLLTFGNLICGIMAIYFIFSNYINKMNYIYVLILFAILFDLFDGLTARLLKVKSEIGKELDSLSDSVSFVLVPAFIVGITIIDDIILGLSTTIIIAICGFYRLASFNLLPEKKYFIGMATPIFTTIVLLYSITNIKLPDYITFLLFSLLAFLMISRIKYPSFKKKEDIKYKIIIICISLTLLIMYLIKTSYILLGIINYFLILSLFITTLLLDKNYKIKKYIILFTIGLIITGILSYFFIIETFITLSIIYSILFSFMIELSRDNKGEQK